jgi:hypothetical protein
VAQRADSLCPEKVLGQKMGSAAANATELKKPRVKANVRIQAPPQMSFKTTICERLITLTKRFKQKKKENTY